MAGIEYTEPFLDQERFFRFYETLFTSSKLDYNKRIFLSTLNTIIYPVQSRRRIRLVGAHEWNKQPLLPACLILASF